MTASCEDKFEASVTKELLLGLTCIRGTGGRGGDNGPGLVGPGVGPGSRNDPVLLVSLPGGTTTGGAEVF